MIPITQEYFDVGVEPKVFDVASDTLPLDGALMKAILNVSQVSKIHPVNKKMKSHGVRDGEKEDRMIWGARHQSRKAVSRNR